MFKLKNVIWILITCLFLIHFGTMYYGSQQYTWLEDDDALDHATGSVYFAENGNVQPFGKDNFVRTYLSPYPPLYDVIMGTLYKLNGDIVWTLKFFNALMISLSIPIGFLLFRKLLSNEWKALFATFLLAITPCFMSHFIWSQSLALPLMMLTIYCLLHLDKGAFKVDKWVVFACASMLGVFFTQPSTAVFMLLFIVPLFFYKDWKKVLLVCGVSSVIFIGIFMVPNLATFGVDNTMLGIGISTGIFSGGSNVDTSGGQIPSLKDLAIAPTVSKMDQPTGFGMGLFLLLIIGWCLLFMNKWWKGQEHLLIIVWFVTFFILLFGNALPIKLFPHRVWAFLTIPAVLIATNAYWAILKGIRDKRIRTGVALVIMGLLLITCAYPKYVVNTSAWPPGTVWSRTNPFLEMQGYEWFNNNNITDRVAPLCSEEEKLISMGVNAYPYDDEMFKFRKDIWTQGGNSVATYTFLTNKNIKYLTIDHQCIYNHGTDATNLLINQLLVIANPVFANEEIIHMRLK